MSPSAKSSIVELVQKLGLPAALLLLLCWWMANNVAQPLVTSHTQFLAAQVETTKTSATTLERLSQVLAGQAVTLSRIEESQQKHAELLGKLIECQQKPDGT